MTKQHKWLILCLLLLASPAARAQPGGWAVNPAQYQYNMTAVAQIHVNGAPSHLLNNYVAAVHAQGQLRGWAAPIRLNGQAYYFLSLYANQYKDEPLTFRAFIGADQKVYESASVLLFKHHKAVGKIAEPLILNFTLGNRPVIYSLSEADYAEGTCGSVLDVQASDNQNTEGDGLTYTLLSSPDAARFYIHPQTGLLSWRWDFVPDFEMPADANGDNRYEVTVRVTDAGGLSAEQTIIVTVKKTIPQAPLVCPQNQTALSSDDGTGNCSSTALNTYVTTASICQSYELSYQLSGATTGSGSGSLPVYQAFGKGVTTVTYTQTGSNAGQCSFTVTVTDVEPPSITCPFNIVRGTDANVCTAIVLYNVVNGDNCIGTSLARTDGLASGAAFPKGITLVGYKVTDAAGLTAQCAFTVTVNDTQAPNIVCPANIARNTDANLCTAAVTYAAPTATDNCGTATAVHVSGGISGAVFPKGQTVVTWQATDAASLTKTCTFTVTVNDAQLPNITCPSNITSNTAPGLCTATVTYAAPTATDNCTGVTAAHLSGGVSGAVFPKGQTVVTWRATDAAGLTKTCTFRVTVNDVENPVITCPSNLTANTTPTSCISAPLTYATPTAVDNCAPAPTVVRLSGPASGSTFPRGSTFVTWRAIDAAGRSSTCSFSVTVNDVTPPAITCPPSVSVTAPPGQCSRPVTYTTPTATDNCSVQSVFLLSGLVSGSTFQQGTTLNTWRALDNSGLSATCSFTVTVNCGSGPSGMTNSLSRQVGNESGMMNRRDTRRSSSIPDLSGQAIHHLSLNLFPNPATTDVVISIENLSEDGGELTVTDAQGRLMGRWRVGCVGSETLTSKSKTLTSGAEPTADSQQPTVNVSDFAAGLYFVTLRSADGQVVTKRLVVQRL